jgi:hypothetical protein
MEKQLTAADVPFTTDNAMLAFCLRLAGVPTAHPHCVNIYNAEILKRLGYSGRSLEDATREAVAAGKKGNVRFQFKRVKGLSKLTKAFAAREKEITAEGQNEDVSAFVARFVESAEDRVGLGCVILKLRGGYMNQWKNVEPLIQIMNVGDSTTRNTAHGKVTSHPGFRLVNLNASQETREHLKV